MHQFYKLNTKYDPRGIGKLYKVHVWPSLSYQEPSMHPMYDLVAGYISVNFKIHSKTTLWAKKENNISDLDLHCRKSGFAGNMRSCSGIQYYQIISNPWMHHKSSKLDTGITIVIHRQILQSATVTLNFKARTKAFKWHMIWLWDILLSNYNVFWSPIMHHKILK